MPRISYFYGISIYMYRREHSPPHFHVIYQGRRASFNVAPLGRRRGRISARAERMVLEWASQKQLELLRNWDRAQSEQELVSIDPLD
jgi:hypothetical protein